MTPIDSCRRKVVAKFVYENIITRFGFPLINDRGAHFINKKIKVLSNKFLIDHHKISSYNPHSSGVIESFNKTLTKGLIEIYDIDKDLWDNKSHAIMLAYIKAYKRLTI